MSEQKVKNGKEKKEVEKSTITYFDLCTNMPHPETGQTMYAGSLRVALNRVFAARVKSFETSDKILNLREEVAKQDKRYLERYQAVIEANGTVEAEGKPKTIKLAHPEMQALFNMEIGKDALTPIEIPFADLVECDSMISPDERLQLKPLVTITK